MSLKPNNRAPHNFPCRVARAPLGQHNQANRDLRLEDANHTANVLLDHAVPFGLPTAPHLHHLDLELPFGNRLSPILQTASLTRTELSSGARATMDALVSSSTLVRKHNYVQKFLNWAATENLTPADVLPANETILCNYAATFAGHTAGGTARAHLSAIKGWTLHKGHPWFGAERLNTVLSGVKRRAPPSSFRPPRAPVKESHLEFLRSDMNLDGSDGKESAVLATATLMFYGQLRAGEVLPDSGLISCFNPRKHPRLLDLSKPNNQGTCSLFLPSTKTSRNRGETVSIAPQQLICPIKAMTNHIRINRLQPEDPLLAYRDDTGQLHCLTRDECVSRCNDIWSLRGIPKISGHCFRIGGTTHYLCRGVPPDVVKALGRWKSDAFLTYWRDLDTLASLHLHRHHAQELYHSRLYVDPL